MFEITAEKFINLLAKEGINPKGDHIMAIQITNAKYIGKKKYCEISCTSTDEKPVGLVYIALSCQGTTEVVKASLSDVKPFDRENIRREAANIALWLLLNKIR